MISLSSNAQYIEQQFLGDTITIDSAVVMDLGTYRSVRESTYGAVDIINAQKQLTNELEKALASKDSTISILDQRLRLKEESLVKKDEAILNLSLQFDKLDQHTEQTLNLIQDNKKPFWKRKEFWIGLGIQVVVVSVVN